MRRSDREIKDFNEIIEVINKCEVCRLAFFDEEYPYILPLNFGKKVSDGKLTLYFHGGVEGKKYELIEKNNKVSFEMDCSLCLVVNDETKTCTMEYESVIGSGIMSMVEDKDKFDALSLIMEQYHQDNFEINEKVIPYTKVFQLSVNTITGKKRMTKKLD